MYEENFDDDVRESMVIGKYDSGHPFSSVLELLRCGECDGLYKQDHYRFIMGMYIAPTGQDAIRRQNQADEHNRKLDEIFIGSKHCYCHGRNGLHKWLP
jgi:hypothetical protein